MTWTVDRETATETFRLRVLAALDEAAQEVFADRLSAYNTAADIFGTSTLRDACGATDQELPVLFPAIDAQLERVAERYDAVLVGGQ
jgi:hypothetical protein